MSSTPPPPGGMQRPTPQQIAEIQRRVAEDARKAGMTVPEFIEHIKKQAMEQQRQQQQGGHSHHDGHQHAHHHDHPPQGQSQPITPGPPNPKALAVAGFLKSQDLKPRTCILNDERKDMFKGALLNHFFLFPLASLSNSSKTNSCQQSNAPYGLFNHPPTKRPARRTLCCPKLRTELRLRTPSSCCRSACLPFVFPKLSLRQAQTERNRSG